ncbi:MAG: protein kinase domain-containing protein, partial [Sciscionella sp.]
MATEGDLVAGRYRLGERIGAGAMGVLWQALDERLHRTVALKQLILPRGLDPADAELALRRAEREGRIAAKVHSPNIVTVYDVAEHEQAPWLVMEYL